MVKEINRNIYNSIVNQDYEKLEQFLQHNEANIFEVFPPVNSFVRKFNTPFKAALQIGGSDVLTTMFEYLENKESLPLEKPYTEDPLFKSINYLQYICWFAASASCVKVLKKYCDKKQINFEKLINNPIKVVRNNQIEKISMGEMALMQVSIGAIQSSWNNSNEEIDEFNDNWFRNSKDMDLSKSELMHLNFCGAGNVFLALVENGLDVEKHVYNGKTILALVEELYEYSQPIDQQAEKIKNWNKSLQNKLLLSDEVKLLGDAYINNNQINIDINSFNMRLKNNIKIKLIINYNLVQELLPQAIEKATNNKLAQMQSQAHNQRFQVLESKFSDVESKLDEVESKVANISEVRCENVRKAILGNRVQQSELNNIALNCFDNLHKHLVNVFTARSVGASGLVKLKNTSESLELLKLANTALSVTVNNISVPFVGLFAATTTALVEMAENRNTKIANQNYFDATVGINTNLIAIDVALIVTAQAMNVYGNLLDAAVIKELKNRLTSGVNTLSTGINSELALICALIRPATQYIKAAETMGVVQGKQFTPALMNVNAKNNKVAQEPKVKKTNSGKKRLGCTIS